jgi:hypothetical protein
MITKKTYKVSARIQIQDGTTSHIKRFKDEIEHDGNIGDPSFEVKILNEFCKEIKNPMAQTELATGSQEAKDAAKKVNADKKETAKK